MEPEVRWDAVPKRGRKIVRISRELIVSALRQGATIGEGVGRVIKVTKGLPDDAEIMGHFDASNGDLCFIVSSAWFPVVPDGAVPETYSLTFTEGRE